MEISKQTLPYDHTVKQIEEAADVDVKLTLAIQFMKDALSNGKRPRFRDFWRMKKVCLDLFKTEIHKTKRVAYWEEYTALLAEAHALQKIIEEQVEFQAEQIDLAIDGLDKEYEKGSFPSLTLPSCLELIVEGKELYILHQTLSFLNRLREQALSFRKEVLSLEIRVSQKNKLLAKLTKVSDKIFPERKKCFQEITRIFLLSVDNFVSQHFDKENKIVREGENYFNLRSYIKAYQATLKILMISNDAYGKIRKSLSNCWDMVTTAESKHRENSKNRREKAPEEVFSELEMIETISPESDYEKKLSQIYLQAKNRGVSQEALYLLRKKMGDLKETLEKQEIQLREQSQEREKERKDHIKKLYQETLEQLESLQKKAARMKIENVTTLLEEAMSPLESIELPSKQMIILEQKKQQISLVLLTKMLKAEELVVDELAQLHSDMKDMLQDIKAHKRECGLDIETAFVYDALFEETKTSMDMLGEQLNQLLASIR